MWLNGSGVTSLILPTGGMLEELRIPIMFYEKEEFYEGEFVIVHNNLLYKYVLTNDTKD